MAIGTVKWFDDKKGFGFIKTDADEANGEDVFVHFSDLLDEDMNGRRSLDDGNKVEFEIMKTEKGVQAFSVSIIPDDDPTPEATTPAPKPKPKPKATTPAPKPTTGGISPSLAEAIGVLLKKADDATPAVDVMAIETEVRLNVNIDIYKIVEAFETRLAEANKARVAEIDDIVAYYLGDDQTLKDFEDYLKDPDEDGDGDEDPDSTTEEEVLGTIPTEEVIEEAEPPTKEALEALEAKSTGTTGRR